MNQETYYKAAELMQAADGIESSANSLKNTIGKKLENITVNKKADYETVGMFSGYAYPVIEKHLLKAVKELQALATAKRKEFEKLK